MESCRDNLGSSDPNESPNYTLDKPSSSSGAEAAAAAAGGQPVPLAGATVHPGTGYNQWMRERRAKGDTLPLLCCLGFLCTVLWRHGTELPTPYLLYFATMVAVSISLLAWQHSGVASYLHWRDWVHAGIRLDAFFNPAQLCLMQLSWAADAPPSRLAALPLIILNSGTVQLFVLSFVHCVSFPCQLLLQSLCAARVAVVVLAGSWQEAQFAQHPNTQQCLCSLFEWFEGALGPFSWLPVGPPKGTPFAENNQVIVMVVVCFGLLTPLALQAAAELRTYRAFCRQQQQLQLLPRRQVARDVAADRLLDHCHAALLPMLGSLGASPFVLLLFAIALWDALGFVSL